ncbi:MAG: HNH endonuclease [Phycisphaerae bacterium]|nr:HNH endonuclease [Phycisphaerae bacterium]
MAKDRTKIPPKVAREVLDEYRHRCAICGGDKPQFHHVDEDPSNHDPMNLLPLCPNCHLADQHDPTSKTDVDRLRMFRQHKDPAILDHRFVPLWRRCQFILHPARFSLALLQDHRRDLLDFVADLHMGTFYCGALLKLFDRARSGPIPDAPDMLHADFEESFRKWEDDVARTCLQQERKHVEEVRDQALSLIVELLRYQNWLPENDSHRRT